MSGTAEGKFLFVLSIELHARGLKMVQTASYYDEQGHVEIGYGHDYG